MKKFPLFASLDISEHERNERSGNLFYIRKKLLHSDDLLKFANWNKHDFENSLRRGKIPYKNRYFSVLCVSIYIVEGELCIYLESGELLSLDVAIYELLQSQYPFISIFLYCKYEDYNECVAMLGKYIGSDNILLVISKLDRNKILFALSCEVTNWWGLSSCITSQVSFYHIQNCLITIIKQFRYFVSEENFIIEIINEPSDVKGVAWIGGDNLCADTDIEKLISNARIEQIGDVIKRIFDNSAHVAEEHHTPNERKISSQGLFWLCEISNINDVKYWLKYTAFYRTILIDISEQDISVKLQLNEIIPERVSAQLISSFILIPGGSYTFGYKDINSISEPPANLIVARLNEFYIMNCLVSEQMWSDLISGAPHSSALPKVDVNYFEALEFAKLVNELLHEVGFLSQHDYTVSLPTEYQWEASARSEDGRDYPWGNNFEQFRCNCEMVVGGRTEIGYYSPLGDSPFGCQDMSGNVREWTNTYAGTKGLDWRLHSVENVTHVISIAPSSRLVIKGGSYSYSFDCVTAWMRNTQIAERRDGHTGFRLVINI